MSGPMGSGGPDAPLSTETPGGLRTNAPADVPQRTPRAPDTPWGRLRGARGWSLRELSRRSGVNPADLSRIEHGLGPTPDQARLLLTAYDENDPG